MAVGKIQHEESIAAGLKFVRSTRIMGRKRVVFSRTVDSANCCHSPKRLSRMSSMERLNRLEALPQDILVLLPLLLYHQTSSDLEFPKI